MENYTNPENIQRVVRDYYGGIARISNSELSDRCGCSPKCCTSLQTNDVNTLKIGKSGYSEDRLEELPDEVTNLSLGCGDPVTLASLRTGQTVVDLGSGGGLDCFLAASKVGSSGKVIGIDMTSEMIERAREYQEKLGLKNVEFRQGEIEHLPIEDNCVDVIISNCVINLSTDKLKVFQEAYRVLKPGGKFAVSDIVTDGQLPTSLINNLNAWAGCIAGALDINTFLHHLEATGFVGIEVKPHFWEADTFDPYVNDLGNYQQKMPLIDEKIKVLSTAGLQAAIFSAKITAWKPTNYKVEDKQV